MLTGTSYDFAKGLNDFTYPAVNPANGKHDVVTPSDLAAKNYEVPQHDLKIFYFGAGLPQFYCPMLRESLDIDTSTEDVLIFADRTGALQWSPPGQDCQCTTLWRPNYNWCRRGTHEGHWTPMDRYLWSCHEFGGTWDNRKGEFERDGEPGLCPNDWFVYRDYCHVSVRTEYWHGEIYSYTAATVEEAKYIVEQLKYEHWWGCDHINPDGTLADNDDW